MTAKMKSMAIPLKRKTIKDSQEKRSILLKSEMCFFTREHNFSENLLNLKRMPNYEVFAVGKKRFYRRKPDFENLESLSDIELIQIAQAKNRDAYSDLFKRYQKKLFIYIYRLTRDKEESEDILQNVFIKTYKNIHHFDLSRLWSGEISFDV